MSNSQQKVLNYEGLQYFYNGLTEQFAAIETEAKANSALTSIDQIEDSLSNKVDKVDGKGLSTNDYTTTEKNKLEGIEIGATKVTVDTALTSGSTNAAQSGAVYTALSGKVDKVSGKGLSTNDFTTEYLNKINSNSTKLSGIAAGAEVNQNAFSNFKVGSTTIAADGKTDTLELVAGSNITLTPDTTNDKITIAISDLDTTLATAGKIADAKAIGDTITNLQNSINTKFNNYATTTALNTAINNLVDGAPEALNTLNELAAALDDNADYYNTVNTLINKKADLTALNAHMSDTENPHEVVLSQLGVTASAEELNNNILIRKEGYIVQHNCLENKGIAVTSNIEPIQSGSGDPYPAGGGKNLAKSIYASGETAVYSNCLYVDADIMPNTTYTISFVANADNANMLLYLNESLASYQDFRITGARQSVTFTTKESMSSKPVAGKGHIMFKNGTALAAPMTFADVQLELGSTATAYAPSSNIRPITGHTGAKLTRSGKNLLPFMTKGNTFEKNGMTGKVTDAGLVVSGMPSRAYADVVSSDLNLPAGTYTVRGGNPSGGLYTQINVTRADGTAFYYNDSTFELYGDEKQVQAFVQCSSTIVTMSNYVVLAQLEAGSTATTFAPYQGETFSASFDQTVYGGILDWNTGVLTVDRAIESLTSAKISSITDAGTSTQMFVIGINNASFDGYTVSDAPVSSHYTGVKWSSNPWNVNNSISYYAQYNLRIRDTRFDSVSAYGEYVNAQNSAGTPVQVCYKLAKPYTIQLSPHQIKSLKGINTIYSSDGISSVVFNSESLNYDTTPISVEQTNSLVTVENGIDGYGFKATSIIELQQAGSGDPYPAGGGKNLLGDYANGFNAESTLNGLQVALQTNGTLKITGTPTKQWNNLYEEVSCNIPAGEYVYSYETDLPNTITVGVALKYSNGTYVDLRTIGSKVTLTENAIGYKIFLENTDTTKNYNNTLRLQLEQGSTPTSYAPYANIRPITGRTGAVLTRCGKNLIDSVPDETEASKGVTFSPSADGFGTKIQGTSTGTYAQNAPGRYSTLILPPGDYIFSAKLEGNYGNANVGFIYRLNDANAGTVDVTGLVKLLHLDSETKINWFAYVQQSGVTVDCTAYLQLELGSTATRYEPYQGETFSAPFGQTVYGGTLDWNKGEMVVDRGYMELTGSEGWEAASSAPNAYYINQASDPVLVANVYPGDFYTEYFHSCSHYKANVYSSPIPNGICTIYSGGGGATIMFRDDRCTSVDAFKAYLAAQKAAGTPVQITYKIATPTTIQLTPQHLTMLQGKNNFYSNSSTLKIKTNTSIENYYTLESFNLPSVDDFLTKNSIVSIVNGGTGAITAEQARVNLGITPANIQAAPKSHTHNYAGSSSAGGAANTVKVTTSDSSEVYGSSPYYPAFSSTVSGSSSMSANTGLTYVTKRGTETIDGFGQLVLGNNIASGTAGNKYGAVKLHGRNGGSTLLQSDVSTASSSMLVRFPNNAGEVLLSSTWVDYIYPVGSVYISFVNTNPATLFGGGTWEQIKDTFLLSAGDTYAAGSTGGEARHILTETEMPSHKHECLDPKLNSRSIKPGTNTAVSLTTVSVSSSVTSATGNGQAHNNMPPYLTVYMWKRTA